MSFPRMVTVLIDNREKYPLLFPASATFYPFRGRRDAHLVRISTKKVRLKEGDYALEGYESRCLVERKGSFAEVGKNVLSSDYRRSHSALTRLSEAAEAAYLLLEETISGMMAPGAFESNVGDSELILDAFLREIRELGVQLIWAGRARGARGRRRVGLVVVHLLLQHAFSDLKIPNPLDDFQNVG